MKSVLIFLIKGYVKLVSPILPATCRFYPTCSHYAVTAIDQHGAIKGLYYATRRLLKCHPYYKGEFVDPVPPLCCERDKSQKDR